MLRNALNSLWCYWMLRKRWFKCQFQQLTPFSVELSQKRTKFYLVVVNLTMFLHGRNGTGFFLEKVLREGYNPIKRLTLLESLEVEDELPYGDTYDTVTEIIGGTFQKKLSRKSRNKAYFLSQNLYFSFQIWYNNTILCKNGENYGRYIGGYGG